MSSESSSSSSKLPTPEPVKPTKTKKSKDKGKQKAVVADGTGKNEGTDPDWEYKPPPGSVLLENTVDAGEFDWDAINNDEDVELWLIRVPDSVSNIF